MILDLTVVELSKVGPDMYADTEIHNFVETRT